MKQLIRAGKRINQGSQNRRFAASRRRLEQDPASFPQSFLDKGKQLTHVDASLYGNTKNERRRVIHTDDPSLLDRCTSDNADTDTALQGYVPLPYGLGMGVK